MRFLRWPSIVLLAYCVCLQVGCGGGGSQGHSVPPNPVPTLSGLSPNSASAGSALLTVTASGSGFISTSAVEWNGAALATTYVSGTSLTAQIPASDLTAVSTASVTVASPAPGGGTSASLTFAVNLPSTYLDVLNVEGSDLAWNPIQQQLYVAVPSTASSNAGTITIVDPIAGSVSSSATLSSAASGLAISDDSQYLYAVINAASEIQRYTLPAITPDIQWSLGTVPIFGGPNLAADIKVQPGASHTVAVSLGQFGSGSVAVFDDAVERPAVAGSLAGNLGNSLLWKADGSELYAAYTLSTVSGYFATASDDALYTMSVSPNGVAAGTTYHSSFRGEGSHLHSDATTGYVYGDWGEVLNGASGIPVGNYRWSRPIGTYFPGPLSVIDPTLARFYTLLEVIEPNNIVAFQIQVFNQTNFQLLSTIVIPAPDGIPTNFMRWGQAGLAFVTSGPEGDDGKLYILDGGFVNPSATPDTTAGSQINPVPTLTAISPLTATVGSQALTLTVTGRDFVAQPTVYWNGTTLQTTVVNSTELSVQVPASDLTSVSQAAITASNAGSAFPASNAMPFSVNAAPPTGTQISAYSAGGNDLVWDASAAKIYVSMPGVQGDLGDAIGIVDPVAGTVTSSGFLGSDPAQLALSSDDQYLYVALNGANAIQQLNLPSFGVNAAWNLGGASNLDGPYYALDLEAAPGAPQTTAVTLANFDVSPSPAAVVIYDGSTPRPVELQVLEYPYSALQWAGTDTELYAVDQEEPQDFLALGVGSSGAVFGQNYGEIVNPYSNSIHYDVGTGLVYTDGGQAIQPSNGTVVGSYGASGIAVPDSTLETVFILGQTAAQVGTSNYTIESFGQTNFTATDSITIDNVVGAPTALIRWGTNGLAFTTLLGMPADFTGTGPGQLYVVSGDFVAPATRSPRFLKTSPLLPVRRTWGLGTSSRHRSRSSVIDYYVHRYQ
jgi:hypothetical protein